MPKEFKETQHWAFSKSELKSPETLNSNDKLVALCGHKYGLFVLRNGMVTGYRTNGEEATQQEIFDAEDIRELVHPKSKERTQEWKDVYVDDNGKFVEFFEDPSLSTYKKVYVDDMWGNYYKYQGGGQFKKANESIIKKIIKEEVRKALREFFPTKGSHKDWKGKWVYFTYYLVDLENKRIIDKLPMRSDTIGYYNKQLAPKKQRWMRWQQAQIYAKKKPDEYKKWK
jgi:hypothetical protein